MNTTQNQNQQQYHNIKTNQTENVLTLNEIRGRINCGSACLYSFQELLPYCLLSSMLTIRVNKMTVLPIFLCGCEIRFYTFEGWSYVKVFENKVFCKICGLMKDNVSGQFKILCNG
jgi:hypothetical protein